MDGSVVFHPGMHGPAFWSCRTLTCADTLHSYPASFETPASPAPQDEGRYLMALRKSPHPEEPAKPASRRTHGHSSSCPSERVGLPSVYTAPSSFIALISATP